MAWEAMAGRIPRRVCGGQARQRDEGGPRPGSPWPPGEPGRGLGGWPPPCARGLSQPCGRSAGCRSPLCPPPALGRALQAPGGRGVPLAPAPGVGQRAAGCDRLPAAAQGDARAASSSHGQGQLAWQHGLSKICNSTIKRVGPPEYPGATASARATGKAGGRERKQDGTCSQG